MVYFYDFKTTLKVDFRLRMTHGSGACYLPLGGMQRICRLHSNVIYFHSSLAETACRDDMGYDTLVGTYDLSVVRSGKRQV